MVDEYDGLVKMLGRWGDLDNAEVSELCFESEVAFDEHVRSPERTPSPAALELICFHLTKTPYPLLPDHLRLLVAWQKLSGVDLTDILVDHRSDEASAAWGQLRAWLAKATFGDDDARSAAKTDLQDWSPWFRKAEWRKLWGNMPDSTFRQRLNEHGETNSDNQQIARFPIPWLKESGNPIPPTDA